MPIRLVILGLLFAPVVLWAQRPLDLSGFWHVELLDDASSSHFVVHLPGTLDEAGVGTPSTLTPQLQKPQLSRLTRRHAYLGRARYERQVDVPPSLAGRPLRLVLERVLWQSRLSVDGQEVGQVQESLVGPHTFLIERGLTAGSHTLTLTIDNRKQHDISVDNLAHSYTNDTQVMWNGVLGQMQLCLVSPLHEVQVYPDVLQMKARVVVRGAIAARTQPELTLNGVAVQPVVVLKNADSIEMECDMSGVALWSEFTPIVHQLTVRMDGFEKTVSFGMRSFTAAGNRLLVNGHPTFLRGTLECCVFPLTGRPPMDERGWAKVFTTAREYGLNHLRFHSWCPPEAAFRMADKMGFYCQVELPNWSLTVNSDSATARFLRSEYDQIVRYYGNHPSLCIISCGNELQPDFRFLNELTHYMREHDPRHLYTTSTFTFEKGHGQHPEPEDQVFITQWTDHGWVRGQGVFDERVPDFKTDYREAAADVKVPLISHEIGQYSVYPHIGEIDKYTGVLDPLNFKAVRDDLRRKGLLAKAPDFLQASGRLAALLYKEEIERAMKTPQQSGFQLLDLHDFPGQGTALVGLLDAFWDSKGLIEPQRFREFCAPVVPLARFDKAVYRADETFQAQLEVANYSMETIENNQLRWQLTDATGTVYAEGKGTTVSVSLKEVNKAQRMELLVMVDATPYRNRWSVWVYPAIDEVTDKRLVPTRNVEEALRALKKGRSVLLSPDPTTIRGLEGKFLPVFWSPVHFPKQAGTMGLLCNPDHPALKDFPTDMHSDWQWWNLVKRSCVMVLDSLPCVTPLVECVDNFVNNRRLATVFEARIGRGRLIMSSIDLLDCDLPEVKQLRYSLMRYMTTPDFEPQTVLTADQLCSLLQEAHATPATKATSIYD